MLPEPLSHDSPLAASGLDPVLPDLFELENGMFAMDEGSGINRSVFAPGWEQVQGGIVDP